jgi:hypothetical protein
LEYPGGKVNGDCDVDCGILVLFIAIDQEYRTNAVENMSRADNVT